jgi:predicted DsbA family dithiol-disulfide isomerase
LQQEFAISDEWLPYEIHPDTPAQGVLLADYFPDMDAQAFFRQLDVKGKDMGVRFGPQTLLSNSREALEAGEFAKEHGGYHEFHEAMFRAYFTDCKDIGKREVVLDAAREAGLDTGALSAALDAGIYLPRLTETTRMAQENEVRAAPTFFIEGFGKITGAQPIETFRSALRQITQGM